MKNGLANFFFAKTRSAATFNQGDQIGQIFAYRGIVFR
jgi:hypothetical protein